MKKKVLFIIPSLGGGGAEKVLVDILQNIDYAEYKISLLVIHYFGPYLTSIPPNVSVIPLYQGKGTVFVRLFHKILRVLDLYEHYCRQLIANKLRNNFDTAVSFTSGEALYFHQFLYKQAYRNVSWVHIDMVNNHKSSYPFKNITDEKRMYVKMNEIVFVSNDSRTSFNKIFDIPEVPQQVIYNLIDTKKIISFANEKIIDKNKFTIVSVGRLIPVKGYDRLIRVTAMLKKNNYNVIIKIIGTGNQEKELKTLAVTTEVSDMIEFIGFQANPYPYIKAADIFISCSVSEAFSLVVAEALTLGLPVVATKTTGPIEMLANDFGILTEHSDEAIYKGITSLIDDKDKLEYYKMQALNRSKMFDVSETMNKISSVF